MDLTSLPAPLERPVHTFSGRTVEVVRDLILNGNLRAGERINEVELSSALGISRGPLREAIQHLRSEGLLVTVSHRGAYVRTFSERELSELYEVRVALETHALRLVGHSMTPESVEELRQMLAETDEAVGTMNTYPRELDFHQRIVLLADNESLMDAVVEVHRKIHLARSRSGHQTLRARRALSEHREVLEHLADGRTEQAAQVLAAHLHSSFRSAVNVLISDEGGSDPHDVDDPRSAPTARPRTP
jgi:DNA-binding GntR family transcriptional regulator